MTGVLLMFLVTVAQNASFTLVSRARNSSSLGFHALAAVASNGVYLLVLREVVTHLDSRSMMLAYLAGSVVGSVAMHWLSMRLFEKGKRKVGAA